MLVYEKEYAKTANRYLWSNRELVLRELAIEEQHPNICNQSQTNEFRNNHFGMSIFTNEHHRLFSQTRLKTLSAFKTTITKYP